MPLTILTGFLGAGKTTLLNRILSGDHGLKVAVLVNDFGSVNIDADLIVGVEGNVVSLANGCMCCSLRDDLVQTVMETIDRPDGPEFIVLEASGIAEPGGITMAFNTPALRDEIRLDSVTCVVDADQVFAHPEHPQVNQLKLHQIAFSDMVVLNKVDLAGPAKVAAAHRWIDDHFNNIRVFETNFAEVPSEILLAVGRWEPGAVGGALDRADDGGHPSFDTWTYTTDRPMSLPLLRDAARRLPGGVFRCKGIIRSVDEAELPSVLQVVCRRVDITAADRWRGTPETRIVVISAPGSVSPAELQALFDSCVASDGGRT